jgi:uncharacterized protein (TIGR03790 family)
MRQEVIRMRRLAAIAFAACFVGPCPRVSALEPRDVFILANKNMPESRDVAAYYRHKRQVPAENLLLLDVPGGEDISREDYNRRIVGPLRELLKTRRDQAKVLLTVFGFPLRVGHQLSSEAEQKELAELKPQLEQAQAEAHKAAQTLRIFEEEVKRDKNSPLAATAAEKRTESDAAHRKAAELEERQRRLQHVESLASVDSELMLLWWDNYPTHRWLFNPLHWQFPLGTRLQFPNILMTCRLDGPNPDVAKRIVDDSIAVERKGVLTGRVYVDARGIKYNPETDKAGTAYGGYDESMREMARLLLKEAKLDVTLDDKEPLFPAHSCPDCALYCGWYALQNYQECCKFVPGAVAWHLASLEAVSLRNPGRQWAGNILRDGAAATIGPVAEPYTVGFPKPAEFFGFLATGEYTLVECYARTTLLTSWTMTLIGDPLYNPYKGSPKLKTSDVQPSPQKAARLFPG